MIRRLVDGKWLFVGIFVVGMVLQPTLQLLSSPVLAFYDWAYPVVVMDADIVARAADSVDLHIYGKKQRDCRYMGIQSFLKTQAVLSDANQKRTSMPETGQTKPLGNFDIGVWRVWPIAGAEHVLMYVQHSCNGRHVLT